MAKTLSMNQRITTAKTVRTLHKLAAEVGSDDFRFARGKTRRRWKRKFNERYAELTADE